MLNLQAKARSGKSVEAHYDIGNDLYTRMLDQRMVYTCAYWKNATTLAEAQENKLDLVCRSSGSSRACACSTSAAAGAASRASPPRSTAARSSA